MSVRAVRCVFFVLNAVIFWALTLVPMPVKGATVTVTNFNGPQSSLLGREDGSILTNGIVWLGSFNVSSAAIRQAVEEGELTYLQEAFVQFGKATAVFFNGLPGLYQDAITQAVGENDALAGQKIYTVISNQGMLRDAEELLIFEHDLVFLPDPNRIEPALLAEGEGELIVGEFGTYRGSLGQIIDQPMFTLARVIPEPSGAGLLILALAFFGSRRCSRGLPIRGPGESAGGRRGTREVAGPGH